MKPHLLSEKPRSTAPYLSSQPRLRFVACAILSLCLALTASAANITVTNTADSGPGSLRQAIIDVPSGGTIVFAIPTTDSGFNPATGMYTITQTSGQYVPANGFTLTGPGQNVLTISGNHAHRLFETILGNTYSFSGVTFANGYETAANGGAFLGRSATLTFTDCAFVGNTNTQAYGTVSGGTSLTFTNCLFQNNFASFAGGIYVEGGVTTVSGCAFVGNSYASIANEGGSLTVLNSTISGSGGSGIYNDAGTAQIAGCTISGSSDYNGAGINNFAAMTVSDCTITQNTSNYDGGGIYNYGSLFLSNSTVTQNTSGRRGGGVYTDPSATLQVSHSIIAGNINGNRPDVNGAVTSQGYNLIGNSAYSTGFGATGDQVGTAAAPLNPMLGPLQDNGGPTFTQMPLTSSPAIDAGNPAFNVQSLYYDQRGYQRVANGRIDIGAVESSSYQNTAPTAVPGNPVSVHDTSLVTLNGSASFDDNTPSASLRYAWMFTSKPTGSNAALSNANTATPSFRPDLIGNYQVQLIVTDTGFPALSSTPKTVLVSSYNQAPVAQASVSKPLPLIGQPVSLSSAGSMDPDGDTISYRWKITSAPAGSTAAIGSSTAATASITPDKAGTYTVTVTPSDFLGAGTPASVTFNATTQANYVHDQLAAAIALVQALPASQVTSRGNQAEFILLLQLANAGAQQNCQIGYLLAIVEIDLAKIRTDGVPLRGSVDTGLVNRDWILDANAQRSVYANLINARSALANLASGH